MRTMHLKGQKHETNSGQLRQPRRIYKRTNQNVSPGEPRHPCIRAKALMGTQNCAHHFNLPTKHKPFCRKANRSETQTRQENGAVISPFRVNRILAHFYFRACKKLNTSILVHSQEHAASQAPACWRFCTIRCALMGWLPHTSSCFACSCSLSAARF